MYHRPAFGHSTCGWLVHIKHVTLQKLHDKILMKENGVGNNLTDEFDSCTGNYLNFWLVKILWTAKNLSNDTAIAIYGYKNIILKQLHARYSYSTH